MADTHAMPEFQEDVPLSPYTTLGLGGRARLFTQVASIDQLCNAFESAGARGLPVHVIGGGSNIIVPDGGLNALVIRIALRGIRVEQSGDAVILAAAAGEPWDDLVRHAIASDLAGIECLSGIPGLVGATPIQNVGAYGQEVGETIVLVRALERRTLKMREFSTDECAFAYRRSRFKGADSGRYVIVEVHFALTRFGSPGVRYPELKRQLEAGPGTDQREPGRRGLEAVREAVLTLRRRKSMLVDPADPNSRSVGSFYLNPVLSADDYRKLAERWHARGEAEPVPAFPSGKSMKVPAAWLVEHAGYGKGYRKGGVGISAHHALALVNLGGSTRELLALADEIQGAVYAAFGVRLEREPVVLDSTS